MLERYPAVHVPDIPGNSTLVLPLPFSQLVEAYVKARLGMVEAVIRGDVDEDDLDVPERLEEQLEVLPGICR